MCATPLACGSSADSLPLPGARQASRQQVEGGHALTGPSRAESDYPVQLVCSSVEGPLLEQPMPPPPFQPPLILSCRFVSTPLTALTVWVSNALLEPPPRPRALHPAPWTGRTLGGGGDLGKVDALLEQLVIAALRADAPVLQHRDVVRRGEVLRLVRHLRTPGAQACPGAAGSWGSEAGRGMRTRPRRHWRVPCSPLQLWAGSIGIH